MRAPPHSLRWCCCLILLLAWGRATTGRAHPLLVSFVDVRIAGTGCEVDVTVHAQDLAQELGLAAESDVLAPDFVARFGAQVSGLVRERLTIDADGVTLLTISAEVQVNAEQRSVRVRLQFPWTLTTRILGVRARLFPTEPQHQTFLSVYADNRLRIQDTFSGSRFQGVYQLDADQTRLNVFTRYAASGIQHIVVGPDHILFLIGLLVAGGGVWPIVRIVTAFTVAHSVTLSLAVLGVVTPPARVIEPAIALSICVVGLDNLLRRPTARDHRVWIALFFGLVHGFGFASVLAEAGLPRRAMGLALFAFNAGVEIGQLAIVAALLALFVWMLRLWPTRRQPVTRIVSGLVIAAGFYWLVERLFFF